MLTQIRKYISTILKTVDYWIEASISSYSAASARPCRIGWGRNFPESLPEQGGRQGRAEKSTSGWRLALLSRGPFPITTHVIRAYLRMPGSRLTPASHHFLSSAPNPLTGSIFQSLSEKSYRTDSHIKKSRKVSNLPSDSV